MSFEPEHITDRVLCIDNTLSDRSERGRDDAHQVSFIRVSEIVWARYRQRVVNLGSAQQKYMYEVEVM